MIAYTGIPLLYSGDEIGQMNDWNYKNVQEYAKDSRWLHRASMDWDLAQKRNDLNTVQGQIFTKLSNMIHIRKSNSYFTILYTCFSFKACSNPHRDASVPLFLASFVTGLYSYNSPTAKLPGYPRGRHLDQLCPLSR